MPLRVGIYGLLAAQKYNRVDLGGIQVSYQLLDIREFDVAALLASGNPGDMALVMLARDGVERLGEIVRRASELPEPERRRVLAQMTVLAGCVNYRNASKWK
jgi:hypothetical protein